MSMLAAPDTITGPLTAADLADARAYSKGSIWRQPLTGDELIATYCAPEGGQHADPVPTKTHKPRPDIGIALLIAPWLAGVIGWALYVRWMA